MKVKLQKNTSIFWTKLVSEPRHFFGAVHFGFRFSLGKIRVRVIGGRGSFFGSFRVRVRIRFWFGPDTRLDLSLFMHLIVAVEFQVETKVQMQHSYKLRE